LESNQFSRHAASKKQSQKFDTEKKWNKQTNKQQVKWSSGVDMDDGAGLALIRN